jgi:DNA-binding beta-propeller fold protein YncE
MSRQLTRVLAVVMAGTALSGAAAAGAGLPAMAAPAVQAARASTAGLSRAAVPGAQLWARRYNGPVNGANKASSVAVSPDGKMVFVTGRSQGHGYAYAAATVAYRAATGTRLWTSRDISPGSAAAIALSPRGGTVFMAGNTEGRARKRHYATIAYRAATGTPLWTRRYRTDAFALALAVSPGGGTVFVTGTADVTVAYRAATGRELWASPPGGDALGEAIAVSPDGKAVFVTGRDIPAASYATVAYDAATGARLWARKYSGSGSDIVGDAAKSVAVSPDGRTVFVTGRSTGATTDQDYATIAYNAATGTQRWVSRYNGPGNGPDAAWMMALSPDGRTVFVSGSSTGATAGSGDYATLA